MDLERHRQVQATPGQRSSRVRYLWGDLPGVVRWKPAPKRYSALVPLRASRLGSRLARLLQSLLVSKSCYADYSRSARGKTAVLQAIKWLLERAAQLAMLSDGRAGPCSGADRRSAHSS